MIRRSLFLRLKGVEDAELDILIVVDMHVLSATYVILNVFHCLVQAVRKVATMGSNVLFLSMIVQHFGKLLIVMLIDLLVVFVIEMNISCSRQFLLLFCNTATIIILCLLFGVLH
jgi:hypothetical protein